MKEESDTVLAEMTSAVADVVGALTVAATNHVESQTILRADPP